MRKAEAFKYLFLGISILGMLAMMIGVRYFSGNRTTCIVDALGFQCLGCNISGAFYALTKGDIGGAFRQNPLIFLWITIIGLFVVDEVYHIARRFVKHEKKISLLDRILGKMFKGTQL